MRLQTLAWLTVIGLAVPAYAAPPKLAIMKDAPSGEGEWKMEILAFSAEGVDAKQVPKSVTLCVDLAERVYDVDVGSDKEGKSSCEPEVHENTADRARVSLKCEGHDSEATIRRESAKSFVVDGKGTHEGNAMSMQVRYSYQGPCSDAKASPFGTGALRGVEMNPEQCAQIKAQTAAMDPKVACASLSGEAKAQCTAQMNQAIEALKAACP